MVAGKARRSRAANAAAGGWWLRALFLLAATVSPPSFLSSGNDVVLASAFVSLPPPERTCHRSVPGRPYTLSSAAPSSSSSLASARTSGASTASTGQTLYEVLESPPTATRDELKRAYRRLARQTHPDANVNVNGASSVDHFNEIAQAWSILSDTRLRRRYDRTLRAEQFKADAGFQIDSALESSLGRIFGGVAWFLDRFQQSISREECVADEPTEECVEAQRELDYLSAVSAGRVMPPPATGGGAGATSYADTIGFGGSFEPSEGGGATVTTGSYLDTMRRGGGYEEYEAAAPARASASSAGTTGGSYNYLDSLVGGGPGPAPARNYADDPRSRRFFEPDFYMSDENAVPHTYLEPNRLYLFRMPGHRLDGAIVMMSRGNDGYLYIRSGDKERWTTATAAAKFFSAPQDGRY